ncbi:thermonuclease family protein [Modicisalibacter xianhensis]|nr:thermonuclease family protein [Halomonas xianhensis]
MSITRQASVDSIFDGDTFRATVENWQPVIGERMPVRIASIDTPELRSRCDTEVEREREKALARKAKQFAVAALRGAERIELRQIERGSFFRLVAEVYVDGESLGDKLLEAGLAMPYEEGGSWCGR